MPLDHLLEILFATIRSTNNQMLILAPQSLPVEVLMQGQANVEIDINFVMRIYTALQYIKVIVRGKVYMILIFKHHKSLLVGMYVLERAMKNYCCG